MIERRRSLVVGITTLLFLMVAASATAGLMTTAGESTGAISSGSNSLALDQGSTLVVDDDGGAEYEYIRVALHEARDGDTIEVRPGTYEEELSIDKEVTLVAPSGATLDGSSVGHGDGAYDGGTAITIGSNAAPTVKGFTIVNYLVGVEVRQEAVGAWTLADLTIRNSDWDAVRARTAQGDWTIRDSTIVDNTGRGIVVEETTGDWVIEGTTIRNNDGDPRPGTRAGVGVDAGKSTGDWTIRDSVISEHVDESGVGLDASNSEGAWTIQNTTIAENTRGLTASVSSGPWTVTDSTFLNTREEAIEASDSTGAWSVHSTSFLDDTVPTISAVGANPSGDATGNWWGSPDGPAESDCFGNVTCVEQLGDPPTVPAYDGPGAASLTDGGTYFVGQTVSTGAFDAGDSVELLSGTPSGDSSFVTAVPVTDGGQVQLSTGSRSPGPYYLADGAGTTVAFDLVEQQLTVSSNRSSVNVAENARVAFTLTSNRDAFEVIVASDQADAATLAAAFDDGFAVDTDGDGEGDAVRVDGGADRTLTADLASLSTGSHNLSFDVGDTPASATQSVTLERSVPGTISFESPSKVVTVTAGEEAEIPLTFQDTATGRLTVGSEEVGWKVNVTVSDDDGDGSATVLLDTAAAGGVGTFFTAAGGDAVSDVTVVDDSRAADSDPGLNPTSYSMVASVDGRETDVGTLSVEEPSPDESDPTSDDGGPGFGPLAAVLGLLVGIAVLSHRRD